MDRNDYNNKLSTFKADMSLQVFEPNVHTFLKDTVYIEWKDYASRMKIAEGEIEDCYSKRERITKKLNESLTALRLGSVDLLTEPKASELNEDSSAEENEVEDDKSKKDGSKSRSRQQASIAPPSRQHPSKDNLTSLRSFKSAKNSSINIKELRSVQSPKSD